MEVLIKELHTKKELKQFIKFQHDLYKDCKYYVPKLFLKELKTFDKTKNPAYDFCDARFWLAYKNGKIAGRIAGIVNHNFNKNSDKKFIKFGWFDTINDENVANELLKCVETWGKDINADRIHGPMGFISFDQSGVLIEGFDEMPTSFGIYNYSYYDSLLTMAGYEKEADWIEFNIKTPEKISEKIIKASGLIKKKYGFKSIKFKNKKDVFKYADALFELINKTYKELFGFTELSREVINNLKKDFYGIINPDYVSIVLNENDDIIGFGIAVPSMSKAMQKAGGKFFPFGFICILKALRKNDTVDLLLIAVHNDYQNKGVHSIIFEENTSNFIKNKIKYVEVTKSLESNYKLKNLWDDYENRQNKRTRCYIKNLTKA